MTNSDVRLASMDEQRAALSGLAFDAYAFEWQFLWLERYRRIVDLTIQTILSAFGAILVLMFLFLHPREAIIVASLVGKMEAGMCGP